MKLKKQNNAYVQAINLNIPFAARQAIARILEEEKGYVNRKNDRGGETKFGITKRWYPHVDIKNLTPAAAADIYYADYWCFNKCHCLPEMLTLTFFDCCVNQGGDFARKTLQRLLKVKADGIIGDKTIAAAHAQCDMIFVTSFTRLRCQAYCNLAQADSSQVTNIEGWIDRALDILEESQIAVFYGPQE